MSIRKYAIISAVLAAALLGSLAGCGAQKTEESTPATAVQEQTAESPQESTQTTDATENAPEAEAEDDVGNAALGYTADDLVGRWAESIAGRGLIEISKEAEDSYRVEITWANGAAEYYAWEMTAVPEGEGGALRYENARHYIRTYTSETEYTDTEKYTDGTGLFYLNSAYEVMWEDNKDNAGLDCVFINADS